MLLLFIAAACPQVPPQTCVEGCSITQMSVLANRARMRGAVLLLVSAVSANRELVEAGSSPPPPSPTYAAVGECSQNWCTSPDADGNGTNCWAGSHDERCTCSLGMAKETGVQSEYMV